MFPDLVQGRVKLLLQLPLKQWPLDLQYFFGTMTLRPTSTSQQTQQVTILDIVWISSCLPASPFIVMCESTYTLSIHMASQDGSRVGILQIKDLSYNC